MSIVATHPQGFVAHVAEQTNGLWAAWLTAPLPLQRSGLAQWFRLAFFDTKAAADDWADDNLADFMAAHLSGLSKYARRARAGRRFYCDEVAS